MKVISTDKVDYSYLFIFNYGVDKNWKLNLISLFDCFGNCEKNDEI